MCRGSLEIFGGEGVAKFIWEVGDIKILKKKWRDLAMIEVIIVIIFIILQ